MRAYPIRADEVLPGAIWEQGWVVNSAGYHFHNFFGFGLLDVDAAIKLVKSGTAKISEQPLVAATGTASPELNIPDFNASGAQTTVNLTESMVLEQVSIKLSVSHRDIGDLGIYLTSPSGTTSIVIPYKNALVGESNYSGQTFLANAFYGENSRGTWTLKVVDAKRGISGKLNTWQLIVRGR